MLMKINVVVVYEANIECTELKSLDIADVVRQGNIKSMHTEITSETVFSIYE